MRTRLKTQTKMNRILLVILGTLFILSACQPGNNPVENKLSLNGTWKFYTIYGEGANYMNVNESEDDIIIDNDDVRVEIHGNWSVSKYAKLNSSFQGSDYLKRYYSNTDLGNANPSDSSCVRYYPDFKNSGYYEVFVKYPYVSHLTTRYNINNANGISTKYLNQRLLSGEWISLGIYEFNNRKDRNYIEITAIVSGEVAADAVMFRKISKEKFDRAKEEPSRVFQTDFDDSQWHDLTVPGHWGTINSFSNYTGKGWYRKTIDLQEEWSKGSDDRYYLKFDGVYHLSKVYLNGKYLGMNRGGFTPFEFDVTEALNFDGENVIAVEADNSAIVSATWNWGGIIRDVTLTKNKAIRIDYQYVHAVPDLESGVAEIKLKVRVENNSAEDRTINVSTVILDEGQIGELSGMLNIKANSTKDIHLNASLKANDVELWHFDNPKLYQAQTTISEGEIELDKLQDNFGIRKVELTDSQMLLNGEAVRLAGFNRVSESRFWGSSEPLEVLEKDVDLMKEAGANFMRIMHGTQNQKLIELCDRKGIMLFEEVNVRDLDNDEFRANYYPLAKLEEEIGGKLDLEEEEILMLDEAYVKLREEHKVKVNDKNYFLAKYWLKGMVERDINHPSIIGWSVGNELNNHFEYGREAIAYVKRELDPYRFVVCVSNSGQKEEYTPETDPNTFGDLIMHNMYQWQGEPQEILNALRTKWPDKPIFISEFGFDPFPSTGIDADKEIFSEWTNTYYRHKNEFVIGTSMWTFNDYRSMYGGTTAEENRVWGVITTWRQKRRLFDRIKKEHAPVLDIEVTSIDFENNTAKVRMPMRSASDYPSYAIRNYSLVYQFRNTKGDVISSNRLDVPSLMPGDQPWEENLSWKPLSGEVLDLKVSLMSPTGFSRLDKIISFQKAITPEIEEVVAGKNAARILFEQVPNASEYFVKYTNGSFEKQSYKTIGDFIDVDSLEANSTYSFELYAINDKGISVPSKKIEVTTNDRQLPPIIWDAFISDNKLVIGYSSDFTDGNYTVRYGASKDKLDKEFISNVRGMLSIDLGQEELVYFKIKRETPEGESMWSKVKKVKNSNY